MVAKYLHFSCSTRRDAIIERGLLGGQTACLDNNPNLNLYFVRWHSGIEPKRGGTTKQRDNYTALLVLCSVAHKCQESGGTLDTWIYNGPAEIMIPHSEGEYIIDLENEVHHRWCRQLASARIPPRFLILASSPQDYRENNLNTISRYIKEDWWCTDLNQIPVWDKSV
jgi:hypothetical protein